MVDNIIQMSRKQETGSGNTMRLLSVSFQLVWSKSYIRIYCSENFVNITFSPDYFTVRRMWGKMVGNQECGFLIGQVYYNKIFRHWNFNKLVGMTNRTLQCESVIMVFI